MKLKQSGVVRLSSKDNCVVLSRDVTKGDVVIDQRNELIVLGQIALGHKIASQQIEPGEKILKYGAPIGSALERICAGAHIHIHNMKSDYLPTFTLVDLESSSEK